MFVKNIMLENSYKCVHQCKCSSFACDDDANEKKEIEHKALINFLPSFIQSYKNHQVKEFNENCIKLSVLFHSSNLQIYSEPCIHDIFDLLKEIVRERNSDFIISCLHLLGSIFFCKLYVVVIYFQDIYKYLNEFLKSGNEETINSSLIAIGYLIQSLKENDDIPFDLSLGLLLNLSKKFPSLKSSILFVCGSGLINRPYSCFRDQFIVVGYAILSCELDVSLFFYGLRNVYKIEPNIIYKILKE